MKVPFDGAIPIFYNEFGEIAVGTRQSDPTSIPYVMPANDNVPPRITLSARCRALFHRLVAKDRDASWRIAVASSHRRVTRMTLPLLRFLPTPGLATARQCLAMTTYLQRSM